MTAEIFIMKSSMMDRHKQGHLAHRPSTAPRRSYIRVHQASSVLGTGHSASHSFPTHVIFIGVNQTDWLYVYCPGLESDLTRKV